MMKIYKNSRKPARVAIISLALLFGLTWILSSGINRVSAATITVINNDDSGPGSLRQAIADAAPGDTINFAVTGTITLTSAELVINKDLTIQGPGAQVLTISGNNAVRVFHLENSSSRINVTLSDLKIANGLADYGGGIYSFNTGMINITRCNVSRNTANNSNPNSKGGGIYNSSFGVLTITDCTITLNTTRSGADAAGGGIFNASNRLDITNSTITFNTAIGGSANSGGGGIFNRNGDLNVTNSTIAGNITNTGNNSFAFGGGIEGFTSKMRITNSTICNNTAGGTADQGDGGGIFSDNFSELIVIYSTIVGNTAKGYNAFGGGIFQQQGGSATVSNTIIARNTVDQVITVSDPLYGSDLFGGFSSQGYNLIGVTNGSGGFTNGIKQDQAGSSQSPLDPLLELDNAGQPRLENNGGPTQTLKLLPGSPAIDKGSTANNPVTGNLITTDQRGLPRPADFQNLANAVNGNGSDIGAFEVQCLPPQAVCKNAVVFLNAQGIATVSADDVDGGSTADCGIASRIVIPNTFTCANKGPNPVILTVTDSNGISSQCQATVTVLDNLPPTITCLGPVTAVAPPACPLSTSTVVNYNPPTFIDNCPGTTVACNPPAGSSFPVGTSAVTCRATDAAGNTASCSFTVIVFDLRLQDDTNPATVLLFNSRTGQYQLCAYGSTYTGTGGISKRGCSITLTHNAADRRLQASVDISTARGNASLQLPAGTMVCSINDRDIKNDSTLCQ
jgi:hypothetical protein